MYDLRGEIVDLSLKLGISATELSAPDAQQVRREVRRKSTDGKAGWIWEHLVGEYSTVNDRCRELGAWAWPVEFVGSEPSILFFNEGDDPAMFQFAFAKDLLLILEEFTASEYYVTNQATTYLFCYSHEEFLYAHGSAASWLEKRQDRP